GHSGGPGLRDDPVAGSLTEAPCLGRSVFMILGLEIALLIMGIIALITGKLTLNRTCVVRGTNARVLGVIALLPLPVAFTILLGLAGVYGGRRDELQDLSWMLPLIEAGITIGILVIICIAAALLSESKDKPALIDERRELEEVELAAPAPPKYPK